MYKKDIEKYQEILINSINQDKESLLLSPLKSDDITLYPVGEHISMVKDIERNYTPNGMSKLTLQFKNKIATTVAYIDRSIQIGSVVSTIGFLVEEYGIVSSYYCKGGINPVLTTIMDINKIYPKKVYRMGVFLELSEITEPTKTYRTIDENVQKLEGVKGDFYYIVQDKETPKQNVVVQNILDKIKKSNSEQPIDTCIFSNIEDDEEEDYPDEDAPIGIEENNQ